MKSKNGKQCAECKKSSTGHLTRLGIHSGKYDFTVALAGNPNTGKSTVFNRLTGLHQHTGNWPGKTVTRAEGGFIYQEKHYKLIDLPGTYSLLSNTRDEEIARNYILFGQPDVTIIVVDSTRLERNLNLVLQILEITEKTIVCLNLTDEASRHQLKIDEKKLAQDLGVPVISTSARNGEGIPKLLQAVHEVVHGIYPCKPHRIRIESEQVKNAIDALVAKLGEIYPDLPNTRWVALRLIEGDQSVIQAIKNGTFKNLVIDQTKKEEVIAA